MAFSYEECLWNSIGLDINDKDWFLCPQDPVDSACFCQLDGYRECADAGYLAKYCYPRKPVVANESQVSNQIELTTFI